jgi:LysM repeat protein
MASFSDRIKTASDGRKYIVVIKGDTLSEIAESYYGDASKYKQLASINNIKNPDLIYVGETIYFSAKAGGSSSTVNDTKKATIQRFGLQADIDNVLFVTWDWGQSNTAEYQVDWDYYTANKQWFHGNDSTVTVTQSTYSIPSNAK